MVATAFPWRPATAGGLGFGLAFLGGMLATLAVGGLGLPRPVGSLLWLGLLAPLIEEAGKLAMLRLAGGPARWGALGIAFGLCEAVLLLQQPDAPLAAALGFVMLHGAIGSLAATVARRTGRLLPAFALAVLLHALARLVAMLAALGLARNQGLPPGLAGGYAGLAVAVLLAALAGYYAAATASGGVAASPNASASSR